MKTKHLGHETTGLIIPDWPAPDNILALCTTRVSFQTATSLPENLSGYQACNLAQHVGDDANQVKQNRKCLADYVDLPDTHIAWLEQVHGTRIVSAPDACQASQTQTEQADASICQEPGFACAIMTADCLPVLFCNLPEAQESQQVAAAHAGWRSLAGGILTQTLMQFPQPEKVIAWLGPAISQAHFEVGQEVYNAFVEKNPDNARAFKPSKADAKRPTKWQACLYTLARIELEQSGIKQVYGGTWCTFEQAEWFYSYRRDGAQSGRMASLIMLKE